MTLDELRDQVWPPKHVVCRPEDAEQAHNMVLQVGYPGRITVIPSTTCPPGTMYLQQGDPTPKH